MRRAFHSMGFRRLLLALAVLWAMPCLVWDVSAGAPGPRASVVRSVAAPAMNHHDHALMDAQAVPLQRILSSTRPRGGRSPLTPIVRVALLPAYAWTLSEPASVSFRAPADSLPPSTRPLLASLPDRAPPIV